MKTQLHASTLVALTVFGCRVSGEELLCSVGSVTPAIIECGPVNQTSSVSVEVYVVSESASPISSTGFDATVTFDWGASEFSTVYSNLAFNTTHELNHTYVYNQPGLYETGYTVAITNPGGACDETEFSGRSLTRIGVNDCEWGVATPQPSGSVEPSPSPTVATSHAKVVQVPSTAMVCFVLSSLMLTTS